MKYGMHNNSIGLSQLHPLSTRIFAATAGTAATTTITITTESIVLAYLGAWLLGCYRTWAAYCIICISIEIE